MSIFLFLGAVVLLSIVVVVVVSAVSTITGIVNEVANEDEQ